jgi:hypothetical protein
MTINVTVRTNAGSSVTIKPNKTTVTGVTVAPSANISLGSLNDVNAANTSNGKTLVFNSTTNKFEASDIFVAGVSGGTF